MTNKSHLFLPVLCLLALVLTSTAVTAEVRYVVDPLIITMRSGQSTQHQILRTWPSNTPLEILETGEQYSKARGPDGTEGWVLNQYITAKPTSKLLLEAAEKKLAKVEAENARFKTELTELKNKEGTLSADHQKLSSENKKQTEELTHLRRVAAKPLQLENENQRQENQMLGDSSDRDWFLNGAGVTILGIIIGLVAPRLKMRKKSSWGSL